MWPGSFKKLGGRNTRGEKRVLLPKMYIFKCAVEYFLLGSTDYSQQEERV